MWINELLYWDGQGKRTGSTGSEGVYGQLIHLFTLLEGK